MPVKLLYDTDVAGVSITVVFDMAHAGFRVGKIAAGLGGV